jgi:hypothetical protein
MTPKRQKLYDVAPEAAPLIQAIEDELDAEFLDRELLDDVRLPIALQAAVWAQLVKLRAGCGGRLGSVWEVRQFCADLAATLGLDDALLGGEA